MGARAAACFASHGQHSSRACCMAAADTWQHVPHLPEGGTAAVNTMTSGRGGCGSQQQGGKGNSCRGHAAMLLLPHHSPLSCSISRTCWNPPRASLTSSDSSMPAWRWAWGQLLLLGHRGRHGRAHPWSCSRHFRCQHLPPPAPRQSTRSHNLQGMIMLICGPHHQPQKTRATVQHLPCHRRSS